MLTFFSHLSFKNWVQNYMMISKFMTSIKDKPCLFMGSLRGSNNSIVVRIQYKYEDKALNVFRTKREMF